MIDDTHVLKFQKPVAPAINKGLDMLMIYPVPTNDSPFNLTPLSILYPGAMFEAQGMRVEYIDLRWDSWQMMEDLIKNTKQIGVSCFTGFQCARAHEVLERAKQINPKVITNLGGHHARLCTEDVKHEPLVDVVWPERAYGEDLFPFSPAARSLLARLPMPSRRLSRRVPARAPYAAVPNRRCAWLR